MISEIFLHVGLPKTATSSIQYTLFSKKNSKFLEDNDYLYPKHWPINHSRLYSSFCDHPEKFHSNIFHGYNVEKIKKVDERFLQSLEKELKKTTCTKLIISTESIPFLTIDNLLNLRNYFLSICSRQVKFNIIIYVRNPISHNVSIIQQYCKIDFFEQSALQQVIKDGGNVFQKKIEKLIEVFGSESVKVYSFEEAIKHKFGPVGYFLALLNVNDDVISRFHYERSNEGLSMFSVKFLSYIQMKMPLIINGELQKNRRLQDIDPIFNVKGPKYDISQTDKKAIFENCHDYVIWLKKKFGIDYSFPSISENQNTFEITEEIIHDLKNIFPNLTNPLRLLLREFLQQHADSLNDEKNKILILNLLREFKKYKKPQLLSEKPLVIGFKILSKILPNSVTDKIGVFYEYKIRQAR